MIKMAENLGIPEENRYCNFNPTFSELQSSYLEILKAVKKLDVAEIPSVLFVYVGGHGASKDEKQVFLLNSSKPKEAIYYIELKLRHIIREPLSLSRIFAIYDCCRVKLESLHGLAFGRGN